MLVAADVVFTVAMVAVALGAVAEFQLRIGHIRPSANAAAVGVQILRLCIFLAGSTGEGDDLWLLDFLATGFNPPGKRKQISDILTEEQQVIADGYQREQIVGEEKYGIGVDQNTVCSESQVDDAKDPGLYRNDEEQQKLCIGEHGGVGQKQAGIQIQNICIATEEHTEDVHQYHTGEII